MDRQKIIIIVILVLIAVVYVLFVVRGSVNNDKQSKSDRSSSGKDYEPSPAMSNFGSLMNRWLGRFLPKAEINNCPNKPAPKSEDLCENLNNVELIIPAADAPFRVVKVILVSDEANIASIEYHDTKDEAVFPTKDRTFPEGQSFFLPNEKDMVTDPKTKLERPATEENIIILSKGGKLKISCKSNDNKCRVKLQ